MILAILGGTGRTGRVLIDQALEQGHVLRVLARHPERVHRRDERLSVVPGDARIPGDVHACAAGSEALLSVLGPVRDEPAGVMTLTAQNLLSVLPQVGVRRVLTLTGAGVPHPGDKPNVVDRLFRGLLLLTQAAVLADSTTHADLIRASRLDWTIIRAPRLTDGPVKPVKSGPVGTISPMITRASVANFMLGALSDPTTLRQAPAISN